MAERRIRYGWLWLLFLASLFGGAALLMNDDGRLRWLGIALLVSPLAGFLLLTLAYYRAERRDGGSGPPPPT
ncbi:MAG TPA: hypothetical protein VI796_04025 [Candidatus Thermoplasmatota archaeon]|nr:hypothetical protein [Candidatus Thermoplasmatota archaeon]